MSIIPSKKDRYGHHAEEMRKIGAHVVKSDEGDWRREQIRKLNDVIKMPLDMSSPEKALESLEAKYDEVVTMLREAHVPWARGGTNSYFAELLFVWERINGRVKAMFSTIHQIIEKRKRRIRLIKQGKSGDGALEREVMNITWNTVRAVVRLMYVEVFSRALALGNICWLGEDVAAKEVIAVSMPMIAPFREKEDMTSEREF